MTVRLMDRDMCARARAVPMTTGASSCAVCHATVVVGDECCACKLLMSYVPRFTCAPWNHVILNGSSLLRQVADPSALSWLDNWQTSREVSRQWVGLR